MNIIKNIFVVLALTMVALIATGCKHDEELDVRVTTYVPQDITTTTVRCGGDVIVTQGLSLNELGVCWSKNRFPTVDDTCVFTSNWKEPFVCTITGLEPTTEYHVRAFALRGLEYYYGEDKSFATQGGGLPSVITSDVTNITPYGATCGGVVSNDGGVPVTERGVCWSTNPNPTIDNFHSSCGAGLGSFSLEIVDLEQNTLYYVRAFAKNHYGVSYGEQVSFTTISDQLKPFIDILGSDDYIQNGDVIELGYEYTYGFRCASNAATQVELSRLVVVCAVEDQEEVILCDIEISGTEFVYEGYIYFAKKEIIGSAEIIATVTDAAGNFNEASIKFDISYDNSLEAVPFTWKREGSNPGEGLAELGLKWTKNLKDSFAVIEPVEGAILYAVPSDKWNEVTTEAELYALFSDGGVAQPIIDYRGVSCSASHTYNDLIATWYEGYYYLIHITKGTVVFYGANVVIEGEWK